MIVYSLIVVGLIVLLPPDSPSRNILLVLDFLTCFIFLADFLRSLFRASNKVAFLKWGWLDLVGSIPQLLILRLARLARLWRVYKVMGRENQSRIFRRLTHRRAESAIGGTGLVALLALTIGSLIILQVERQNPLANIRTSSDALWWSFVTITTVGYGDHYPVTVWGRLMAALLMTVGVGIFGVLTSYLATVFLAPAQKESAAANDTAAMKDDIAAMHAKLERLERLLNDDRKAD